LPLTLLNAFWARTRRKG